MKRLFTSLMALALLTGGTQARKWTDNQGRQIEAEFVSQDETKVVLKLPSNGKSIPVLLATLSEADREFLRAKAAEANAPVTATGKYAAQWTGSFEQGNFGGNLPFLLRVPKDLKTGGKYPLLLFLHGAGEKGNDNQKQLKHDFEKGWKRTEIHRIPKHATRCMDAVLQRSRTLGVVSQPEKAVKPCQ